MGSIVRIAVVFLVLVAGVMWHGMERTSAAGVTVIAAGSGHTCAVTTATGVKCWGYNALGQLGQDTQDNNSHLLPADVLGLTSGISTVAAGGVHTCAVTQGGGVKCWGYGLWGQLGTGACCISSPVPLDVVGLNTAAVAIAAGGDHTCVLTTAAGVKCWGRNLEGQLGDGTTTFRANPTDVVGLGSNVLAIAAGGTHTCALTSQGSVKCWGMNNFGQLGAETADTCTVGTNDYVCSTTPVDVGGLGSIAAVEAGTAHTCALTAAGGVQCWGLNGKIGRLGGDQACGTYCATPQQVSGLGSGVAAISVGGDHSCVALVVGGVACWGGNGFGQLGNGNCCAPSPTPIGVQGLNSGIAVITSGPSSGGDHTCVLMTSMQPRCWGFDGYGQLGDGTTGSPLCSCRASPVDVAGKPVGGFAELPDVAATPLETRGSSGPSVGALAGVAGVVAGILALGGAVGCARRRRAA